jgi:hypothetical protein
MPDYTSITLALVHPQKQQISWPGLDNTFLFNWYILLGIFQAHQAFGHEVCALQHGIALGT